MNLPSLTNALNFFGQIFDSGRDALTGNLSLLFQILVTFEVVFAGLYLTLGNGTDFKGVARKILTIGFFSWIIQNYGFILKSVIDGFIFAGQTASSSSGITFATIQDPDRIFSRGLTLTKPAVDKLFANWDMSYLGIPSLDSLLLVFCIIISVLSFGIMAIQVFVTYLEFLLISTAGFILVPFGVFKPTAFLAERMFGAIIGFGIKLMVLALVVAVSDKFLETISLPETVSWQQGFEFVVIALALCFLTLHAPSVALSLLSGSPHLSFGTIATTATVSSLGASRTAQNASSLAQSGVKATAYSIGASTGGAVSGWSSMGSITQEKSLAGKLAKLASKSTSGALGAVSGQMSAVGGNTIDKITWGKDGGPSGQARYRATIGDESLKDSGKEGLLGSFNQGRFSVGSYRKHDATKRSSSASLNLLKSSDNSLSNNKIEDPNQKQTNIGGSKTDLNQVTKTNSHNKSEA